MGRLLLAGKTLLHDLTLHPRPRPKKDRTARR